MLPVVLISLLIIKLFDTMLPETDILPESTCWLIIVPVALTLPVVNKLAPIMFPLALTWPVELMFAPNNVPLAIIALALVKLFALTFPNTLTLFEFKTLANTFPAVLICVIAFKFAPWILPFANIVPVLEIFAPLIFEFDIILLDTFKFALFKFPVALIVTLCNVLVAGLNVKFALAAKPSFTLYWIWFVLPATISGNTIGFHARLPKPSVCNT